MNQSDHFDGQRFFNPNVSAGQPTAAVPRMLLEPRARWPKRVEVPASKPPPLDGHAAAITFIGHATFLIQTQAGNLLTDPMYSQCAGPFNVLGPRRVRQPAVRFDDLPPISTVLLSHNHYDHCDLPTLRRIARALRPDRRDAPWATGAWSVPRAFAGSRSSIGGTPRPTPPLPITATPARHFSARTPLDRNRALWSGFMVQAGHARILFAGDTAYAGIFHDIRQRLGPIDLALLPIGAYEPRWFMQYVHMNPAEAVQAHLDLGRSREHRDALRHLPADHRRHRPTPSRPGRSVSRQERRAVTIPRDRFRGIRSTLTRYREIWTTPPTSGLWWRTTAVASAGASNLPSAPDRRRRPRRPASVRGHLVAGNSGAEQRTEVPPASGERTSSTPPMMPAR